MQVRSPLSLMVGVCLVCGSVCAAAEEKVDITKAKAALGKAKVTLSQAIETAVAKTPGKVLGADYESKGDKTTIDVDVLTDKGLMEVTVDAVDGKVVKSEPEKPEGKEKAEIDEATKALSQIKIALKDAIATAEKKVAGGKAFEVALEIEDGKAIVNVTLIAGNDAIGVDVDGVTGQVSEVEKEGTEKKAEGSEKDKPAPKK